MSIAEQRERVVARIREGRRFLITSHRDPDGDALGSSIALRGIIEAAGGEAKIVVRDRWAAPLDHTPGIERVDVREELPPDYPDAWDALFTMECPEWERCGFEILPGPVVNIDHHPGNEQYGEINYLDVDAPSVGEMLIGVADDLGVDLTPDIATAIYISLASDTGFFRYTNTSLRAFEAAERLVASGANPGEISLWLNESRRPEALKLLGECLTTLEMHLDGRVSVMTLTDEMLERAGATPADADGISSYGRTIDGVVAAVFLKEKGSGTRASFRAKPGVDVFEVAKAFGGGGHKAASGCYIDQPIEEAKGAVLARLSEQLS